MDSPPGCTEAPSVSEKKPISTRFVVLPPWDNHITPIIITQWVNHFDNDLRLICFIDIPKNVFTPNLSNYYSFCWLQTWSVIIYIHLNSSFCCAVMKMWAKFSLASKRVVSKEQPARSTPWFRSSKRLPIFPQSNGTNVQPPLGSLGFRNGFERDMDRGAERRNDLPNHQRVWMGL